MELVDYLLLLWRRAWVIALAALVGGAAGYASTADDPPVYRASATVFLVLDRSSSVSELAQGSTYTQGIIQSYVLLTTTPVVLQPVIDDLGLATTPKSLAQRVVATSPVDTVVIDIAVTDRDPRAAAAIANAVSSQLSTAVADLSPSGTGDDRISVTTVAPATAPLAPIGPKTKLMALLGAVLAAALAVAVVVLRELLDTRVKDAKGVGLVTESPVLGQLPGAGAGGLLLRPGSDVLNPHAEAFRGLRSNLQFINVDGLRQVLVVTSSNAGEGKSTTAVNLAVALADAGSRVLLVDADLRRPTIAKLTGLEGSAGLATVLAGRAQPADVVQPWGGGLEVLTSGDIPPNPNDLLGSGRMRALIEQVRAVYDVVVIDTPPLLPVSDAAVLAAQADGALVVVNGRRTTRQQLATSVQSLLIARATVLGVVLNRASGAAATPYYYSSRPADRVRLRRWKRRQGRRQRQPSAT